MSNIFSIFASFGHILDGILFYEFFGFPFLIILLIISGLFFSFYLRFPNIKHFKLALKSSLGENSNSNNSDGNGLLKSKQSLFTSLASVVGMGSIAGVATAIYVGGPGSIFWMIFIVLFTMNTSFSETILAVKYRSIDLKDKSVQCAPVSYIRGALADCGFLKLGIFLSAAYGFMYYIGLLGCQMYQVEEVVNLLTGLKFFGDGSKILLTIIFDLAVLLSVCGGITKIAKIFEKLLPSICGLYLCSVLLVLLINIKQIPLALITIFREAFRLRSATGGLLGALCTGIKRGTYSTEAGLGAGTTPYAAMDSDNPIKVASIGALNPFFTSIMCLASGLLIMSTGVYSAGGSGNGIVLVSEAFSIVSSYLPYLLGIIIPLVSFSLCISCTFGALNVYQYYFGKKTDFVVIILQFVMAVATVSLDLSDIMLLGDTLYMAIAVPNVICLFFSRKIIGNFYEENLKKLDDGEE